ncbi:MAG: DUF554 domain-containing protein [Oscillospiraceae bacterium]|nr:DUF554 domain-containing protein [Oscillospiraceae bacterium]
MIGLGTIVNTAAVVLGGGLGLLLKNGIAKKFETILMQALGLATVFIGAGGVLKYMLVVEDGNIATRGTMLLIFSLVIGCILGQLLDIESQMEKLGIRLKTAVRIKNDNRFVEGFVNTSLIICVGAMAIVGAMEDGLSGDSSTLIAKAVLDFALVVILASTYGVGAMFSAIPIFVYQGAITVIAAMFGAVISDVLIGELSFVGSALIFCVGVNLVREKTFRVANMLPALLIPIVVELWRVLAK